MKISINNTIGILSILIFSFSSCIKTPEFSANSNLKFSKDTVYFDTIFTRKPGSTYPISVTKLVSIKNTENKWVKATLKLGGGKNSYYKFNVDGIAGPEVKDLEIGPKDSAFIFVQCALEANNQINPALILDSIMANVGTQQTKIILGAYGWDAHYIHDSIISSNSTWSDVNKPYVIIGNLYIPPNISLKWNEGIKVFASARTYIYNLGQLNISGTAENRVSVKGDKPVFNSQFLPNQWGGIYVPPGGKIVAKFSDITNASIGIIARTPVTQDEKDALDAFASELGGSIDYSQKPEIVLNQTRIQYCGQACLLGLNAKIIGENCLFADAGSYSFLGYYGGSYSFNHCTFADYSYFGNRNEGHFGFTNTLRDGNGILLSTNDLSFTLNNSIIWGYKTEEINSDQMNSSQFLIDANNNLLKSKNDKNVFNKISNSFNSNPRFIDEDRGNYQLDTLSFAFEKANPSTSSAVDLTGKTRKIKPDLGAYERFE